VSRSRGGPSWVSLTIGILLVVIGGAFLLQNLGIARVDWGQLWPVLLVVGGVLVLLAAVRGPRGGGDTRIALPVDGATRLELQLRLGAGRYRLQGGSTELVDVTANEPTIDHQLDRSRDRARVRLSTSTDWWALGWGRTIDWTIGVVPGIATVLDVQAGAGSFNLDLSEVALVQGRVAIGAADLRIVLPRPRGEVPVYVQGGAANITFEVPRGVEARVQASGLITTSGPSETPGYSGATDRVTVSVSGGAAAVRVVSGS
jgi:LiaI-LiaF-like transmembrane region